MSAQTIKRLAKKGLIEPFSERTEIHGMSYGLSPAGYDIRIAEELLFNPGDFLLASSIERFNMPDDLLGRVTDKSTWRRCGLTLGNTTMEPGWKGFLTLEIYNEGKRIIHIQPGTPIAQILFEQLDYPTSQPYNGKYQDQPSGPVPAKFGNSSS